MNDLARVVKLGELLVARQEALTALETEAAKVKADVLKIEREDLPALMAEIGVSQIRLDSGKTISIKEDCDTRISEANKSSAFSWLLLNGYGGLIKTTVAITFGKGEHDAATAVSTALAAQYADRPVSLDESVHPSTLKAFVKERMGAGDPVPLDLFGVYAYNKAVIKN